MKVFTTIPQDNLSKVPAAARAIEAAGYDGIMTMENAHDPFLPLGVAATVTNRVELITGIAIAFARSPMSAANIGWDLQAASKGRFVMGLGSQIKAHNLRRFSVPWSPPAPHYTRGYGKLYLDHVTQAEHGCDFDFLHGEPASVAEPEIH